MDKKTVLGLGTRLLLFIIPVIGVSLVTSGILTGYYADLGIKRSMNRLMVYKAEDLNRHAASQWNLLLKNDLQDDPAYQESIRRSIRSYAITMLRSEAEWIIAFDKNGRVQFSVGDSPPEEAISRSIESLQIPDGTADGNQLWIDMEIEGERRIGYRFSISALGWTVVISDQRSSYFGNLAYIRLNYAVMVVLTTLVTALFVTLFVRRSMKPLVSVISDMKAIVHDRDFGRRVVPVQNDEVGELAREFNLMSDYLGLAIMRLKNIARGQAEARIEIRNRERETLEVLGRVSDHRDQETALHIKRVGLYASLLTEFRGDSVEEADLMRWAVPLHDIGKVGIPDSILLKTHGLTARERKLMMTHVEIGHEILKDSASPILRAGADIAISHHERWDGSGYPRGLKGTDIPVRGRITGLVDVFDALTSARPYKKAWSLKRAVQHIQSHRGRDFDPELVDLFIAGIDRIERILLDYADRVDGESDRSAVS